MVDLPICDNQVNEKSKKFGRKQQWIQSDIVGKKACCILRKQKKKTMELSEKLQLPFVQTILSNLINQNMSTVRNYDYHFV